MADTPTPVEVAACCGPRCLRGTEESGPCMAATYGAGILRRMREAGFAVITRDDLMSASEAMREAEEDFDRIAAALTAIISPKNPADA